MSSTCSAVSELAAKLDDCTSEVIY